MRLITKAETKKCTAILARAFESNPSVNWVVKNDSKRIQRIYELAKYSFKTAQMRNGAFISSQGNGIALCYAAKFKKEGLADYWNQAILLFKAIGIENLKSVLQRESYIKSKRPKGNYLYFWFFGVEPGKHNSGDAVELKNEIFRWADKEQLSICLETSVEKNKRVYERYGFQLYHTWPVTEHNINLFFMCRKPKKL